MDKFVTKSQMQTILDNRPKGVSMEEVINGYRANGYKVEGIDPTPEQTLAQKLSSTGKEVVNNISDINNRVKSGQTSPESATLQTLGSVAGGATKAVGNVLTSTPVVKDVISAVAQPLGEGVKAFQSWLDNNPQFQNIVQGDTAAKIASIIDAHPDIAKNAEAVNNIANAVLMVKGGLTTAGKVTSSVKTGAEAATEAIKGGVKAVSENPIVQGATDVTKMAGQGIAQIPKRIATNVAEKQATETAIKSLPSVPAQNAVRNGVDILDVKKLPEIVKTPQAEKLIQTVKDFASGNTKIDPIEIVGKPIVDRIKTLTEQAKVIGQKLGEASKSIGVLTKPELQSGVLSRLQSVPGLENISLTSKGLSFKGTTLESALSKVDRQAIQQAFTEATKWGNGEKAHLFRQTLFENLGGKKKSLANITDTQEKAFNAIRSGLSDVIETKSPVYKTLSNEYRKIVQPVSEIRKLMKNIDPSAGEDILNMSAGLLARRITSAAASNPQIRQVLTALDKAGVSGTVKESVTQLQDLYNILNKYYDIAPKTGFQNLVKEGVTVPTGIIDTVTGAVKSLAGQTSAVRQKALEELISHLKSSKR